MNFRISLENKKKKKVNVDRLTINTLISNCYSVNRDDYRCLYLRINSNYKNTERSKWNRLWYKTKWPFIE